MTTENRLLTFIYTLFLGVLLAIFIGVGVNTFYPTPEGPEYPTELQSYAKEPTEEQIAQQRAFDEQVRAHEESLQPYSRNVSIITLSAAVILLGLSMYLERRKIAVLADGVMLGGLFTLLYALGRGFASQDSKYTFVVITIALALVLYLGYHRFVRPHPAPKASKRKTK